MYENIRPNETFDLIVANLPFRHKAATDIVSAAVWDTDFWAHRQLLSGAKQHLEPNGRILMAQASFGDIELMIKLAEQHGLAVTQLAETIMNTDTNQSYYAFEMTQTS